MSGFAALFLKANLSRWFFGFVLIFGLIFLAFAQTYQVGFKACKADLKDQQIKRLEVVNENDQSVNDFDGDGLVKRMQDKWIE